MNTFDSNPSSSDNSSPGQLNSYNVSSIEPSCAIGIGYFGKIERPVISLDELEQSINFT